MNPYIYTFIRDDLSNEQKIVQLGHATWEAGQVFEKPHKTASLILLHADDECDLNNIAQQLDDRGIDFVMFFEPDLPGHTAICTRPIYMKNERVFFKRWELYSHTA
jgi:hypothetical protein